MEFREIQFGSPEYRDECDFRNEILRIPLGLNLYDEDLEAEGDTFHFGLFNPDDRLIGCVIATPLSESRVQIRQMAVLPGLQGQGLGRHLMEKAEAFLRSRDFTEIILHARKDVVDFYRKLGYSPVGDEYVEVSIPHQNTVKSI